MKRYVTFFIVVSLYSWNCGEARSADNQPADEKLVHELGHEDYSRREAATAALIARGARVTDIVVRQLNSRDAEVKWRTQCVLQRIAEHGQQQSADVVAKLQRLGFSTFAQTLTVQRFEALLQSFNMLVDEERYAEAEVVARKAAILYPSDPATANMLWRTRLIQALRDRGVLSTD